MSFKPQAKQSKERQCVGGSSCLSRVEARNLLQRGEHKRKVFVVRFVLIPAFAVFIMLLLKQLQCSARSLEEILEGTGCKGDGRSCRSHGRLGSYAGAAGQCCSQVHETAL